MPVLPSFISDAPLVLGIYHLFTETEGNSVFCGPETVDVSRGEAEGNIDGRGSTKHTAFPRSQ